VLFFIAAGFFNISHLSEKPGSQILIQHYSDTLKNALLLQAAHPPAMFAAC